MSSLSAIQQTTTYMQNGFAFDVNRVQTPIGEGVSVPPIANYIAVPKAIVANYIAAAQGSTANTAITLSQTYQSTFNGSAVVVLDCARCATITLAATLGFNATFTITGYDINYKALTCAATIVAGQLTITTVSAFLLVSSVTPSVTISTTTFTVGTSDRIGLPYYLSNLGDVNTVSYNALFPTINTALVTVGYAWRTTGGVNSTSNDANGIIILPSASDGAKILRIQYYCYGADSQINALLNNQESGAFPNATSTQTINNSIVTYARIQRNVSNTKYVYGTLLSYDLLGPRFPNDSAFITSYVTALAS